MYTFLTFIVFLATSAIYYNLPFYYTDNLEIILSVITFLLAVLTGFFFARQSARYTALREETAKFDAAMNNIYRQLAHSDPKAEKAMKKIIRNHYHPVLRYKWDQYINYRSTTLISINDLIDKISKKQTLTGIRYLGVQYAFVSLSNAQIARKKMVALAQEKIPVFQWFVIFILILMLIFSLSGLPSQYLLFESVFKGAFVSALLAIIFLLYRFDRLELYGYSVGESSARDLLAIIEDKL